MNPGFGIGLTLGLYPASDPRCVPWAGDFICLGLRSLICKMGIMVSTSWGVLRIKGEDVGQSVVRLMHSVTALTILQYPSSLFLFIGIVEALTL